MGLLSSDNPNPRKKILNQSRNHGHIMIFDISNLDGATKIAIVNLLFKRFCVKVYQPDVKPLESNDGIHPTR